MVNCLDSSFFTVAFRLMKQTTSTPTSEITIRVRITITTTAAITPLGSPLSSLDNKAARKRRKKRKEKKCGHCCEHGSLTIVNRASHCSLRPCSRTHNLYVALNRRNNMFFHKILSI